jgi:sugar lactone lactonase YvrE
MMAQTKRSPLATYVCLTIAAGVALVSAGERVLGQTPPPNPYGPPTESLKLGRKWGATSAIDVDRRGNIWVAERCGANSCADSDLPPINKFSPSGELLASFGAGVFMQPHGMGIDPQGNVWVTDAQGREGKGHQVIGFSPDGKELMRLGKAGVAGNGEDTFNQPTDVAIAANGNIFVVDGHVEVRARPNGDLFVPPGGGPNQNARVVKFSKDGKFLKTWGMKGSSRGELDGAHGLAFDSRGRLFVADRTNNRIQMFDQDGKLLGELTQFSRPSGIFIDANDRLYVADSESTDMEGYGYHPGWQRGIRVGSIKGGSVSAFIPDQKPVGVTSGAEGVAADAAGNVYGAEVGSRRVVRYEKPRR